MDTSDVVARVAHDLGLAAWFGGTLMGAAGVNRTTSQADPHAKGRAQGSSWEAWTPVNAGAIALHLTGGAVLLAANKGRVTSQHGVASVSTVKLGLTAAALGATAYARLLGQRLIDEAEPVQEGATDGTTSPPAYYGKPGEKAGGTAAVQRQMRSLQWAIPALTGAIVVANAVMGEQQRPSAVVHGVLQRLTDFIPGTGS